MRSAESSNSPPWLLPVIAVQFILVLGMNLLTSALTVYLRDLEHIMGVLSMAWMYLSPVVYGMEFIPETWRRVYLLNPMAPLILAYRDILYYRTAPDAKHLLLAAGMSLLVLCIGTAVFEKLQRRFAEVL